MAGATRRPSSLAARTRLSFTTTQSPRPSRPGRSRKRASVQVSERRSITSMRLAERSGSGLWAISSSAARSRSLPPARPILGRPSRKGPGFRVIHRPLTNLQPGINASRAKFGLEAMSPKVVVIEDDKDLTGLLRYAFEKEGFEFADTQDGLDRPRVLPPRAAGCHRAGRDAPRNGRLLGLQGTPQGSMPARDAGGLPHGPVPGGGPCEGPRDRRRRLCRQAVLRARASGAGEAAPARPGPDRAGLQARRAGAGPGAARGASQRAGRWR